MKKILFKKILSDCFIFFLITLISTSIIIWVFQAVNYLDIMIEDGRSFIVYTNYTLLSLPKIVSKILPLLDSIDLVLIMSVNPGFGGQTFMPETLEKVKVLRKEIDERKLKTQIEIDGGINFENAKLAKKAGVDILVSGTTIFKENDGNLKKNIQLLRAG